MSVAAGVFWIIISFIGGLVTSALLYRDEVAIYDRLLYALAEGEAAFKAEVEKIKSELAKIHL